MPPDPPRCSRALGARLSTLLFSPWRRHWLVIVLSKCLLLVQFCLAHVFSPDIHKARAVVLCYVTEVTIFPNLCLLASWIVSISGSNNSSVECTFSFVTNILSDKHLSISHNTLENSVIVSGNNSTWSEKEREEIIDRALEIYLSKRRITTLSSEADSVTKLMMNMMKMTWSPGQWRRTLSRRINGF